MELPARYGHYVLLERIAVGGMGEIFKAKYAGVAGFERPCAIKRILPHLSDDEEFADRLIHEAKVAVQLTHANIVQIFELGKIENEYFIAMEWVDGPDLSTLMVRAKAKDIEIPIALSIHVLHEVARALDHAHNKTDADGKPLAIIHRDVSPQNVMISVEGAVKLGDFGIARAGGIARQFATNAGAVLGKRRYMGPEQRRGDAIDPRTDVYALGAILFEMITGEAPDPDAPAPPLPAAVREGTKLPEGLEELTAKMLEHDPAKRLSSAASVVEGLERVFLRMAAEPGAIRDPSIELGRFVRKVCPPGEKRPQRRSLTARMRDAMRPGVAERNGGLTGAMPEGTAVAARPAISGDGDSAIGDGMTGEVSVAISLVEPILATGEHTATAAVPRLEPSDDGSDDAVRNLPREKTEEDELPAPVEPPPSAADGAGVTLVISTIMVPASKPSSTAETQVNVRPPARPRTTPAPLASRASAAETVIGAAAPPATGSPSTRKPSMDAAPAEPTSTATAVVAPRGPRVRTPGVLVDSPPSVVSTSIEAARARPKPGLPGWLFGLGAVVLVGGALFALERGFFGTGDASPTPEATREARATPKPHHTRAIPLPTHVAIATPAAPATPLPTPTPRPRPTRAAVASTPRPRPTARAIAARDALLQLGAFPWANISVDGHALGSLNTDVRVTSGEPHTIVFENPKYGKRVRTVTLRSGQTEKVTVDFKSPE